jgi:hypothetical protein
MKKISILLGFFAVVSIASAAFLDHPWQPLYDAVHADFKSIYALEDFKRTKFGWDREYAFDRLRSDLTDLGDHPSATDVHVAFKHLFESAKDYHSGIYFKGAWSSSELPFGIRTVEGHSYVSYVNRAEAPSDTFPVSIGDELVRFGGMPVAQVLARLARRPIVNRATDLSYADRYLTRRPGYNGFPLPDGAVHMDFMRRDGRGVHLDREWKKVPNSPLAETLFRKKLSPGEFPEEFAAKIDRANATLATGGTDLVNGIGGRLPFVPVPGRTNWTSDDSAFFFATTGRTARGTRVGFIRIGTYIPEKATESIAEFDALIARMQSDTDVLVLDQTNNGGGSVLYFYELLSHLISRPVPATLRFRWSLQPMNFHLGMKWEDIEMKLRAVRDPTGAKQVLGNDITGYPVNADTANGAYAEAEAVLADIKSGGSRLSRSMPLLQITQINPKGHVYTKPIIMLENEWSFSAADMAPAILQDLGRAKIFGTSAPGLGAYVISRDAPANDPYGVWFYSVAMAEVRRARNVPIENNGVRPDIAYDLEPIDLTDGFRGYRSALTQAVDEIAHH